MILTTSIEAICLTDDGNQVFSDPFGSWETPLTNRACHPTTPYSSIDAAFVFDAEIGIERACTRPRYRDRSGTVCRAHLRIPTKPATYSDVKPATVPI